MKRVEIYTKTTCGYCIRAKRLLDTKGVAYEETAIDLHPDKRAEMIQRAGGRTTVPQIFVDGEHIGGCDDLMELEMGGRLDTVLGRDAA